MYADVRQLKCLATVCLVALCVFCRCRNKFWQIWDDSTWIYPHHLKCYDTLAWAIKMPFRGQEGWPFGQGQSDWWPPPAWECPVPWRGQSFCAQVDPPNAKHVKPWAASGAVQHRSITHHGPVGYPGRLRVINDHKTSTNAAGWERISERWQVQASGQKLAVEVLVPHPYITSCDTIIGHQSMNYDKLW